MSIGRLVVIGASAGGIEAVRTILAGLPDDFPAPLCVVLHIAPQSPGVLDQILGRASAIPVENARSGGLLRPGRVYVAPPDHHLLVEPGRLRLTRGPRENRFRPAIDPLFRSAAQVYGPGAIGVILTGNLDDGTAGLWTIKQLGGHAIVQDPAEADAPSMPLSAINGVAVDHIVSLREMAPLLAALARSRPAEPVKSTAPHLDIEVRIAKEENAVDAGVQQLGEPSSYACPDCHGVLLQMKEGNRLRFRCHTGHAYSAESLVAAVQDAMEDALWNAVRALEEGGLLLGHLADHLDAAGHGEPARRYRAGAGAIRGRADEVRAIAEKREQVVPEPQT
jgi:two-component system chemotaxis response regulator CheB